MPKLRPYLVILQRHHRGSSVVSSTHLAHSINHLAAQEQLSLGHQRWGRDAAALGPAPLP